MASVLWRLRLAAPWPSNSEQVAIVSHSRAHYRIGDGELALDHGAKRVLCLTGVDGCVLLWGKLIASGSAKRDAHKWDKFYKVHHFEVSLTSRSAGPKPTQKTMQTGVRSLM
jgi:hypothetical protein